MGAITALLYPACLTIYVTGLETLVSIRGKRKKLFFSYKCINGPGPHFLTILVISLKSFKKLRLKCQNQHLICSFLGFFFSPLPTMSPK